ncbi:hypothetical protein ACQUWZ_27945, partial [Ralstonia pseudosolanacearum]|uniref:hypothetical protein n=1 Tax=Ralstonia pseudosolanacearum TaxID=1310165 RepID=UPI003D170581
MSQCASANEIWKTLQQTHEGTSKVKNSKIVLFTNDYEKFEMQENESIKDMYTRFTLIVNNLKGLGKKFVPGELEGKILRCLTQEWEQKVAAIEE